MAFFEHNYLGFEGDPSNAKRLNIFVFTFKKKNFFYLVSSEVKM